MPSETLQNMLSTGEVQPLSRDAWLSWARTTPGFTGAWFSYVDSPLATSTGTLSTAHVQGYVDVERTATSAPTLRYYRHYYAQMIDGRVFHAGPINNALKILDEIESLTQFQREQAAKDNRERL